MNFLVLAKVADHNGTQFLLLQNLYQSFGCPEGFFIVNRSDFQFVTPVTENTCNIKHDNWEKCLYPISESQKNEIMEMLK